MFNSDFWYVEIYKNSKKMCFCHVLNKECLNFWNKSTLKSSFRTINKHVQKKSEILF